MVSKICHFRTLCQLLLFFQNGFSNLITEETKISNHFEAPQTTRPRIMGPDLIISDRMKKDMDSKSGLLAEKYRWKDGKVFVYYDPAFTKKERRHLKNGLQMITSKTCIRIVTWRDRDHSPDYINVTKGGPGTGCWAQAGRLGGVQYMNLGPGCVHDGVFAHELIHSIGYFHEHQRPDRDDYIKINVENVVPGYEYAYQKLDTSFVSTFGIPYDLNSIMHYGPYDFAKGRDPTIESRQGGPIQQSSRLLGLTGYDAQKLNAMYRGICKSPKYDFTALFNGADTLLNTMDRTRFDESVHVRLDMAGSPSPNGCGVTVDVRGNGKGRIEVVPRTYVRCKNDAYYHMKMTQPSHSYSDKVAMKMDTNSASSSIWLINWGTQDTDVQLACFGVNGDPLDDSPKVFCINQPLLEICRSVSRNPGSFPPSTSKTVIRLTHTNRGCSGFFFRRLANDFRSFDQLRDDPDDSRALTSFCEDLGSSQFSQVFGQRECSADNAQCDGQGCRKTYGTSFINPDGCTIV